MIPLYIFGLLQRFGPQHGYQIKKIIAEQLADFTQIKLPAIYYHLEKMQADGLLSAKSEKPGGRPAKIIYAITDKGQKEYKKKLAGLLEFEYRPVFPSDGVFYFSDQYQITEIIDHLKIYERKLKDKLALIERHKNETMLFVPAEIKRMIEIIFSHHERHFQAELDWAEESLQKLNGSEGKAYAETESYRDK